MDFETVVWGYLPILIGAGGIIGSVYLTLRKRDGFGFITSFLVGTFNGVALAILLNVLNGSQPSYIPHFMILISTVFVICQILKTGKTKQEFSQ